MKENIMNSKKTINGIGPQPGVFYSLDELKKAFEAVQPATHWKDEIDATLNRDQLEEVGGIDLVIAAIEFYTATVGTWRPVPPFTCSQGSARFKAAGYWKGPAA